MFLGSIMSFSIDTGFIVSLNVCAAGNSASGFKKKYSSCAAKSSSAPAAPPLPNSALGIGLISTPPPF